KPLLNRIDEQNLTIGEREDELVRRQKEFTVLTDSMSEGLVLLDKSGKVLVANRSALSLMPECAEGETFPLPESAPSNPAAAAAAPAVKDALRGARREVSHSADGETWRIIANPVSVRGKPSGAVLLLMDVTEREQRERLRREFSANVSHELKTPLTSISGFAELMMNGLATGDKVREFSADIWRESRRMLSLVDDIIRLSRLDEMLESQPRPGESPVPAKTGAGTEDGADPEGEESDAPVWEDVDLGDLAADVLDSLKSSADKREIRLELKAEPDAKVRGVWPILYETVYNLCDNAVKYNRDGGSVTVEVGRGTDNAEEEGEGRDGVRLTVRDTGIGIPKAHRSRVFERFYRVDKSHSQEIGGTGLGLSIVKHGAQLHGAEIELESEVGVGTAVTLFFPPIQS
ncbi:MAG: PAS domain-containing protein, partial [Clostridia bacterium]|nr:PAS domain-containing protein [Clostridia bacterium]